MILGLIAGRWLRTNAPRIPFRRLLLAGVTGVALGLLLHVGICPIVKRIWTPSWTLFSGGVCFLLLAAFAWIIEAKGYIKWAFCRCGRNEFDCGLPELTSCQSSSLLRI
jgi:heparan-alpha-glucosaminide N-acetyltransferase